jgi:hypothetical protein
LVLAALTSPLRRADSHAALARAHTCAPDSSWEAATVAHVERMKKTSELQARGFIAALS